jgi:hypothetical protein
MGPRRMFVEKESKSVQSQILIETRSIAKANQGTSTGESILAILQHFNEQPGLISSRSFILPTRDSVRPYAKLIVL